MIITAICTIKHILPCRLSSEGPCKMLCHRALNSLNPACPHVFEGGRVGDVHIVEQDEWIIVS